MNRENLIKLILVLVAVLLVAAVVAAVIIFGGQNPAAPTQPSGSQSGEPSGTDTVTEPAPSGDVGVGIWDETDPTDATDTIGATDPTGTTGTTEPAPSGSVDVDIWTDPTDESTKPTEPTTQPTQPVTPPDSGLLSYGEYLALSAEQKQAWAEKTFPGADGKLDMTAFFAWRDAAKAEYDAENTIPTIDGSIDLGEILGGNS